MRLWEVVPRYVERSRTLVDRDVPGRYFSASTDKLRVLSTAKLTDLVASTRLAWLVCNGFGASQRISQKGVSADASGAYKYFSVVATGYMEFFIKRATQDTGAKSLIPNFVAALRPWFGAMAYDTSAGTARLYYGTERVPAQEPASYSTLQAGSGTVNSDSGLDFYLGNKRNDAMPLLGGLFMHAVYSRILAPPEIQHLQFNPWDVLPGCVGLWFPGADGAGVAYDYSGNGHHATPTGTTLRYSLSLPTPPRRRLGPASSLVAVSADLTIPMEALGAIAAAYVAAHEALLGLAQGVVLDQEAVAALVAAATAAHEALIGIGVGATIDFEALVGVAGAAVLPHEATGLVSGAAVVPFEAVAALVQTGDLAHEALQALAAGQVIAFEVLGGVALAAVIPHEAEGRLIGMVRIRDYSRSRYATSDASQARYRVVVESEPRYRVEPD